MTQYDDFYDPELDDIEQRIAALEGGGLDDPQRPDDEMALIAQRITEMEAEAGVDLDDDDFQRVGELIQLYGGDEATAFNLVVREGQEAKDAWEQEFEVGIEAVEADLGRKVTSVERDKLIDLHEVVSYPDVAGAWEELYGKRHTEDEIAAVAAKHKAAMASLREEGYSEEFISKYDEENREPLAERVAELTRSGKGEYDLDTREGKQAWMQARVAEIVPETVAPPAEDAPRSEWHQYMATRMRGAERADADPPERIELTEANSDGE